MPKLYSNRALDQPRASRRRRRQRDPEALARLSERAARFLGTGRYLAIQSTLVIIWITMNMAALTVTWRFDPYPFILLNLMFSVQAAYAAPLILLAQNRQDDRDRVTLAEDRDRAALTQADTEYLARELAALRLAIGEATTRDYLRGEVERLLELLLPDQREPRPRRKHRVSGPDHRHSR
jgi:uncharacterized membrane protein